MWPNIKMMAFNQNNRKNLQSREVKAQGKYTGGRLEWDSKEWDSLPLINSTREILEIRIEWDSIEWDK